MLSIVDMAVAFPGRVQVIEDAAVQLALKPGQLKMFKRFYGFNHFPVDDTQPLFALVNTSVSSLVSRHPNLRGQIRILAHCHTTPNVTPFGKELLGRLRDSYFNDRVEIMSLTMSHCATAISMLTLMEAVLPHDGLGLLLIGEKAFHPRIRLIENTTIMGEAAVAVLVGRGDGLLEYLSGFTSHEGRFSVISGWPSSDPFAGFNAFYFDLIVKNIRDALAKQGIDGVDVRYIFPHNVNLSSWLQVANALNISPEKIYLRNISRHGHCFGADPFINFFDALERGALARGDIVLLISAGNGATVSTAVMRVASCNITGRKGSVSAAEPIV